MQGMTMELEAATDLLPGDKVYTKGGKVYFQPEADRRTIGVSLIECKKGEKDTFALVGFIREEKS